MASLVARVLLGSALCGAFFVAACKNEDQVLNLRGATSSGSGTTPEGCPAGELLCGDACSPVKLDPAHCGSCDVACAEGEVCSDGACGVACGTGATKCELGGKSLCVDTALDPKNCGACGVACAAGELCSMGTCGVACAGGTTECGGACTKTAFDPKNCGACGQACFAGAFSVGYCVDGACGTQCVTGRGDCNANVADGCESTLDTVANCGACGKSCNLANATSACVTSSCAVVTCSVGYGNCDKKADNGCEVNTNASDQNCGACGNVCKANEQCAAGTCKPKGLVLQVEGHADVVADCQKGDYSCQAKAICEAVTGFNCTFQDYDCAFGTMGSWYPEDGQSGSSNFNFAFAYDFSGNDYGNICACNQGQMGKYGLAANHTYCGLGHWTRQ